MTAANDVPAPAFVTGRSDTDRGIVVTRFVEGSQGDVLAGCDRATAAALTRSVARLHGRFWQQPPVDLPTWPGRAPTALTADECRRVADRHGDVVSSRLVTAMTDADALESAMAQLAARPTTVLHADLHLDNVMLTGDGPVLLDWAALRRGPAEVDVARCLVEFAESDDGIDRWHTETYCAQLERYGVEPEDGFNAAVDAALRVLVLGVTRWSIGRRLDDHSRSWRLARHTLRRLDALLA